MSAGQLAAGFAAPVPAAQATFRCVLDAIAHPGRIVVVPQPPEPPPPLAPAAYALALALADFETPVWLDAPLRAAPTVGESLRFHCGTPIVADPERAAFAFVADAAAAPALDAFAAGTPEYPDRGATVVLQAAALGVGPGVGLTGPGIDGGTRLAVAGLAADFWQQWAGNHALFPQGVDVIFVAGDQLAALPRSVRAEA